MFKVGDKVRRINSHHGGTYIGNVYTIEMIEDGVIYSFEEFESGRFNYNPENFELVSDGSVTSQTRSESEIVKEWMSKVQWLLDNTEIYTPYKMQIYIENGDHLCYEEMVDFVINSYASYQKKESEKKKQELLDKKAALELELAQINKELGGK